MLNFLQICCMFGWQGTCKSQLKLSPANGGKKEKWSIKAILCGFFLRAAWYEAHTETFPQGKVTDNYNCSLPTAFFHETCLISFKSDSKEKFSTKPSTGLKAISESCICIDFITQASASQETGLKAGTCTKGLTNNDSDSVGVLCKFLVVFCVWRRALSLQLAVSRYKSNKVTNLV